jgi:MoxR-like ATPase
MVSAPVPVATPIPSAPALKRPAGIFREPGTLKPGFKVYHEPVVEAALTRAVKRHAAGKRTVVLIGGPTGVGKSLTAREVAHREGLPFLQIDAAGMQTFADWAGAVSLDESAQGIVTRYAPSQLIEAIRADGQYAGIRRMVLIDEANRGGALNALMTLTDGNGFLYVADARISIPVDPAVLWVLTANIGSQYGDTRPLDAALRNRVTVNLEVGYPNVKDEARMLVEQGGCSLTVAEALVKVATQVRAISASGKISAPGVSTRQLISAAEDVAFGATPLEAACTGFVVAYDGEGGTASERNVVLVAATAILTGLTAAS